MFSNYFENFFAKSLLNVWWFRKLGLYLHCHSAVTIANIVLYGEIKYKYKYNR